MVFGLLFVAYAEEGLATKPRDQHALALDVLGDWIPSCNTKGFREVPDNYTDMSWTCVDSIINYPGIDMVCTPECRDMLTFEEEVFGPGCTRERLVAQGLFMKNVSREFFANGTFPEDKDTFKLLNTYLMPFIRSYNESDDYLSRLANNETARSNATLLAAFVNPVSYFGSISSWLMQAGCLDPSDMMIEDISTDIKLNVTKNRSEQQMKEISDRRDKYARFREALVNSELSEDLPEQCRGSDFIRPSDDYIELLMKCDEASRNHLYPSAEQVCPEECVQYATLSEMELPGCMLAEDIIISLTSYFWTLKYGLEQELPQEDLQKVFMALLSDSTETSYPDDFFDQENRRENYANNATLAKGFLQAVSKDLVNSLNVDLYLGCYRNNPERPYKPVVQSVSDPSATNQPVPAEASSGTVLPAKVPLPLIFAILLMVVSYLHI